MQHVTHRAVRGPSVRTVLAADVDGQLRGIGWPDRPPAEVRAFERHEAAGHHRGDLVGQPRHLVGGVHRCDGYRRVLRHAQRLVAAQNMVRAEAGDAAQHDAGGHRVAAVEVEQRVREEAILVAQALAEVRGELQEIGHSPAPIHWPSHAAARPSVTLTAMLANADQAWRSSPRR